MEISPTAGTAKAIGDLTSQIPKYSIDLKHFRFSTPLQLISEKERLSDQYA
ncbi:hypothetical protein PCAR4_1310010 [Paraburkholderia caribensis]|nr:hypothetical protein PCAR4_1310010 [Paraburkholderia caribensis]